MTFVRKESLEHQEAKIEDGKVQLTPSPERMVYKKKVQLPPLLHLGSEALSAI